MKVLFRKYKSVVVFLLIFLGSYFALSIGYAAYLEWSENGAFQPDFVTYLVARQSTLLIQSFGYVAQIVPSQTQPAMRLIVEGQSLARIVEGCNAVSVIILFVSFVVAFAESFKKTAVFLLVGVALIYATNLLRITILAISLYHYPEHEHFLHGVIFPALLYGMVFLLWIIWVRTLTPISSKR